MPHKKPNRINFTKAFLKSLPLPKNKLHDTYYDAQVNKLAVFVYASGKQVFYVVCKHNGKSEKIKVGDSKELSIENARKKATEILGSLAQNVNPQDAKRVLRKEVTFGAAYDWFVNEYAPTRKKTSSIEEDKALYRRYLDDWKDKKLSTITREAVVNKHSLIGNENGIYAANRMLALVSTIFNKAISNSKWSGNNPCVGVEKFKEKSRNRVLQPKEKERFFKALNKYPSQTAKDCLMMVALTGQRVSNVMTMKWENINLDDKVWYIPESKNGTVLGVPLTSRAFEIVERRNSDADGTYVFPGKSPKGHINRLETAFNFCLKHAKISDLRIHDLRRSLGTAITESGGNTFVVMKALGHKSTKAASVYNHPGIDAVRAFMETAENSAFKTIS